MSDTPPDDLDRGLDTEQDAAPEITSDEPVDRDPDTGESDPPVRVVDRRWWARGNATNEGEGDPVSDKPTYVAELEKQLEDKDALLRDYAARYKQASEEFNATRDRLRREIAKDVERETRRVLASFLEVIDNLDRAIAAAGEVEEVSSLVEGVEIVRQQFLVTLEGHGVTLIDAAGATFDPNLHDAVSTVAVSDPNQVDRVVDIVKPGYRVAGDVLRPATVTVGKSSPLPESE